MSRKALAILLAVAVVIIISISVAVYILSFRTVTLDTVPENVSVTLFSQNSENEIATLEQDESIRLQDGRYTTIPTHIDYSNNPIEFTVEGEDITVTIDPAFSNAKLAAMAESEMNAVNQLLRQTYPEVIKDFTIQPGKLYEKGQWYGTILQQDMLPFGQQGDTYRVVLHKEDDQWQITTEPEIVLSAQKYPDVPFAILTDINAR